jgi:hypothetical protein
MVVVPLRVLLAPLFATLLSAVDGDIGRHLLATAWGHLLASLGWTKHDCLLASGVLSSDVARLLECVPKKVTMLALEQVTHVALWQHANSPLASLAAGLGLDALALLPQ